PVLTDDHSTLTALSPSFYFNDPPTPATYTLSLTRTLFRSRVPFATKTIAAGTACWTASRDAPTGRRWRRAAPPSQTRTRPPGRGDRKSTRLNSSHGSISYAVLCLKKKKTTRVRSICSVSTT